MKPDPIIDRNPHQKRLRDEQLRSELKGSLRQSVPAADAPRYWEVGWVYIMPDFDTPNHSIVEWQSEKMPVYPVGGTASARQDGACSNEPEGESNAV